MPRKHLEYLSEFGPDADPTQDAGLPPFLYEGPVPLMTPTR